MAKLDELRERLSVLNGQAQQIRDKIESEGRDLTVEEAEQLDGVSDQFDRCKEDIDRLERLDGQTDLLSTGIGRKTEPDPPAELTDDGDGGVQVVRSQPSTALAPANGRKLSRVPARPYRTPPGNWNYDTLGQFAADVRLGSVRGGYVTDKLALTQKLAAATIYGNEGVGAEGGFAVPPDFRTAIMDAIMGEESFLSRCDQVTVSGNTFTAPVDMTTPWQTTGGILAYWGGEGQAKTQSKPLLQERTVKVNKCYALVPVTDELLEDASGMDSYLRRKAPEKIAFAVNLAIVRGNGVGQPLGVMSSPALVTVSKESGQVADTIVGNNVIKVYSRMYAPSRSRAVWIINQDIEPQLLKLAVPGTDNTGNAVSGWGGLVYLPANGFSSSPYGTLFGRPVIPSQAAETLGDVGDVLFADFSQYLAVLKGGTNPRVDVSMHLWFDQDMTAFRFVLRVGGIPWWDQPVSARDGATTYSPFVTLEDRT